MKEGEDHSSFDEYYRTETNRRLQGIEEDLKELLSMKTQLLTLSSLSSAFVSACVAAVIRLILK